MDPTLASAIMAVFCPSWKLKWPLESVQASGRGLPPHTRSITTGSGGGVPSSSITFPERKTGRGISYGCCGWVGWVVRLGLVVVGPGVGVVVVGPVGVG